MSANHTCHSHRTYPTWPQLSPVQVGAYESVINPPSELAQGGAMLVTVGDGDAEAVSDDVGCVSLDEGGGGGGGGADVSGGDSMLLDVVGGGGGGGGSLEVGSDSIPELVLQIQLEPWPSRPGCDASPVPVEPSGQVHGVVLGSGAGGAEEEGDALLDEGGGVGRVVEGTV